MEAIVLVLVFITAWYVLPRLFKPKKGAIDYLLENYDSLVTKDFQRVERALRPSDEASLAYALRVSHPIRSITKFDTLEGRWLTAQCGAAAAGLEIAKRHKDYARVRAFLVDRYAARAQEIYALRVQSAKTDSARAKAADELDFFLRMNPEFRITRSP